MNSCSVNGDIALLYRESTETNKNWKMLLKGSSSSSKWSGLLPEFKACRPACFGFSCDPFCLLPFCSDFSAVKNVAGECAWDGVTEGSSGIPTGLVHLVLAMRLGLLCLFCLWNPALSPPCKPSLFFKHHGPGDVAWCGFLVNSAALLSSFILRAPFFLLFLAKIHQAWQVEGSTPGLFHKLSLLLPS